MVISGPFPDGHRPMPGDPFLLQVEEGATEELLHRIFGAVTVVAVLAEHVVVLLEGFGPNVGSLGQSHAGSFLIFWHYFNYNSLIRRL